MDNTGNMPALPAIPNVYYGRNLPRVGDRWQHNRGGLYRIVAIGYLEADVTPHVVYQSLADQTVWVRSLEDFMTPLDPYTWRFRYEPEPDDTIEMPDPYECCGKCGPGLCYVDQMTGA